MENATKALLIAAAVLVAIIIISITLMIVRQGQEAAGKADLSEVQIEAHNSKFKSYDGKRMSIDDLYSVMREVIIHNQQEKNGNYVEVYHFGIRGETIFIGKDDAQITKKYTAAQKIQIDYVTTSLVYENGIVTKILFQITKKT